MLYGVPNAKYDIKNYSEILNNHIAVENQRRFSNRGPYRPTAISALRGASRDSKRRRSGRKHATMAMSLNVNKSDHREF